MQNAGDLLPIHAFELVKREDRSLLEWNLLERRFQAPESLPPLGIHFDVGARVRPVYEIIVCEHFPSQVGQPPTVAGDERN